MTAIADTKSPDLTKDQEDRLHEMRQAIVGNGKVNQISFSNELKSIQPGDWIISDTWHLAGLVIANERDVWNRPRVKIIDIIRGETKILYIGGSHVMLYPYVDERMVINREVGALHLNESTDVYYCQMPPSFHSTLV